MAINLVNWVYQNSDKLSDKGKEHGAFLVYSVETGGMPDLKLEDEENEAVNE